MDVSRYAVCQTVIGGLDLGRDLADLASLGVESIGLSRNVVERIGVVDAAAMLRREGIRASSYMSVGPIGMPSGSAHGTLVRSIDDAAELGAPRLLVWAGPLDGRTVTQADSDLADELARCSEHALTCRVQLMLEPLHPIFSEMTYLHTLRHALSILRKAAGAAAVVDLGHTYWDPNLVPDVRENVSLVGSVQVTDLNRCALVRRRYERDRLGRGSIPVADLIHSFDRAGYLGVFENEVLRPHDDAVARLRGAQADLTWFREL